MAFSIDQARELIARLQNRIDALEKFQERVLAKWPELKERIEALEDEIVVDPDEAAGD